MNRKTKKLAILFLALVVIILLGIAVYMLRGNHETEKDIEGDLFTIGKNTSADTDSNNSQTEDLKEVEKDGEYVPGQALVNGELAYGSGLSDEEKAQARKNGDANILSFELSNSFGLISDSISAIYSLTDTQLISLARSIAEDEYYNRGYAALEMEIKPLTFNYEAEEGKITNYYFVLVGACAERYADENAKYDEWSAHCYEISKKDDGNASVLRIPADEANEKFNIKDYCIANLWASEYMTVSDVAEIEKHVSSLTDKELFEIEGFAGEPLPLVFYD